MKIQHLLHILDEEALDKLVTFRKNVISDREKSKDSKHIKMLKRKEKALTWLISYQVGQYPSYTKKLNSDSLQFNGFPPELKEDIYSLQHYAESYNNV
jgi:hypothetical protein